MESEKLNQTGADGDNVSNPDVPISCFWGNKKSCRRCWCGSGTNKYWTLLNIFNGLLLPVIWIGAAVFSALERPNERQMIEDSRLALNQTTEAVTELLLNRTNMTEEEAMNLTERLFDYGRILAEASQNLTFDENPIWDWSSSVFFCVTVITTIGYGSIAPTTAGGQIFFLFYAIIGIPIALLFLSKVGQIIKAWADRALRPLEKRQGPIVSRFSGVVLLFLVTVIFFLIIPAAIFSAVEGWSYRESIYYSTVSLTTVGFGDFVPGRNGVDARRSITLLYKFMSAVWLWMGLALVAAIITEVQSFFEVFWKWFCSSKNPLCRFCCKRHTNCDQGACGEGGTSGAPREGQVQEQSPVKDDGF